MLDNLTYQLRHPGDDQRVYFAGEEVGDKAMRRFVYYTMYDTYVHFLDELLAGVYGQYNIRKDLTATGIAGESSGGICSFSTRPGRIQT